MGFGSMMNRSIASSKLFAMEKYRTATMEDIDAVRSSVDGVQITIEGDVATVKYQNNPPFQVRIKRDLK